MKCLFLATRSLDPTGTGRPRWTMGWKPALNAFAITVSDRFPVPEPTDGDRRITVSEVDPAPGGGSRQRRQALPRLC
jgi:hypothetical protein